MTNQAYLGKVKAMNPSFKILSNYNKANTEISFLCPICKKKTTVSKANSLYSKKLYGCIDCSMLNKKEKTLKQEKEYLKKVKERNPHLKVLTRFKGNNEDVTYRCPHCKKDISIGNAVLLYSHKMYGCQSCSSAKYGKDKLDKAKSEYIKRVNKKNPHIKVISEYKRAHIEVQCICPHCKDKFEVNKAMILYNKEVYGCKVCTKKGMVLSSK